MRRKIVISLFLLAGLLALSGRAFAHHGSRVSYDMSKVVTMKGTVTEFDWANPHVYCLFDVKDADGKVTNWAFETDSPIVLEKDYNWHNHYLKPGDQITVTVWPSKLGAPRGFLAKLVTADGRVTDHGAPTQ
jgi:Family of unknown function (DUF6152)